LFPSLFCLFAPALIPAVKNGDDIPEVSFPPEDPAHQFKYGMLAAVTSFRDESFGKIRGKSRIEIRKLRNHLPAFEQAKRMESPLFPRNKEIGLLLIHDS
jgi:hypothetical protein